MNLPSAPAAFTVPTLGEVEIHHRPTGFLEWFAGLAVSDGAEVFRAMLRDHGRRPGDDAPIDRDRIAELDEGALRDGASAFLAAVGPDFQPRWLRDPVPSNPGGVRERTSAETEDLAARPGEDELQRLVRVLALAAEDARLGRRHLTAKVSAQMARGSNLGLTPSILARSQALSGVGRLNKMIEDLPGNQLRGLISQTNPLGAPGYRPGLLTGVSSDLLRGGALGALHHSQGLLRTADLLNASQNGLLGLARGGVYDQLLSGALQKWSTAGALASVPRGTDWLKSVNAVMGLGLTAQILAAAAAAQTTPLDHAADLAAFMRPGWQATAAIGMARDDARPAARVVLTAYDEDQGPQPELVASAIAIAHQLDDEPEALFARILAILDPFWSRFLAFSSSAEDEVYRRALFTIATLAIAFAQLHVANEALRVAQEGPTAVQLQALADEAEAVLREEQEKSRQAQRDDALYLRHVSEPCDARTAPDADATPVLKIYPDELIRVVDERGDWVKVEVFQYAAGDLTVAWIPRRLVVHL